MLLDIEFEYYKYLRRTKLWWDYPFGEYNVDIDTRKEKDNEELWDEYTEKFRLYLCGEYRWKFADDALEWALNYSKK